MDAAEGLARLRARYPVISLTILSVALIVNTSRKNRLDWDCVISCEMLGVYKPLPEAYRSAARLLGMRPDEVMLVATHNFDLRAARDVGFRTAFVHRPDEWGSAEPPDPVPDPEHDIVAAQFLDLAEQLGA
jgi:2-haloacid dehalogenase